MLQTNFQLKFITLCVGSCVCVCGVRPIHIIIRRNYYYLNNKLSFTNLFLVNYYFFMAEFLLIINLLHHKLLPVLKIE